jgi:hypothetical protein
MNASKFGWIAIARTVIVASGVLLAAAPSYATENAKERQGARDTKQDTRTEARKEKVDCKKADQKNNAECRQDKRDTKQEGRQDSRDVRSGSAPATPK